MSVLRILKYTKSCSVLHKKIKSTTQIICYFITTHLLCNNITWIAQPSYHRNINGLWQPPEAEKNLRTWVFMSLNFCKSRFSWQSEQVLSFRSSNSVETPTTTGIVVRCIKSTLTRPNRMQYQFTIVYQSETATKSFAQFNN